MTISRNNYEAFIIDYIDGKLSSELREELMAFLKENPDIAAEFEGIVDLTLRADNVVMPLSKYHLKKSPKLPDLNITQAEYLCIAEVEGDLLPDEDELLSSLKKNDLKINRLSKLFKLAKLTPERLEYPEKAKLKRAMVLGIPKNVFLGISSAAAILLFALLINTLIIEFGRDTLIAEQNPKRESARLMANGDSVSSQKVKDIPPRHIDGNRASVRFKRRVIEEDITSNEEVENRIDDNVLVSPLSLKQPVIVASIKPERLQIGANRYLDVQNGSKMEAHAKPKVKEISLADLALMGAQELAKKAGIEVVVKEYPENKTKKIVVDSKLIAFSASVFSKDK